MQVASDFTLDGGMIPRNARRTIDERLEARYPASSSTAMMDFRGRKHVVRLVNVSRSGAMVIFPHTPNIGERLLIQLLDQGLVSAQVMWVKDGRIGVSFVSPRE
jgi:PilZ domain